MSAEVQFRLAPSGLEPPSFLVSWAEKESRRLCWVKADRTRSALGSDYGPEPVTAEMLASLSEDEKAAFKKISRGGQVVRMDAVLCVADEEWFRQRDANLRHRLEAIDSGERWASHADDMVRGHGVAAASFDPSSSSYPDLRESVTYEV